MIMDYEKKYNEALERAQKVKHDAETIGCSLSPDMLEVIFPELAESEDERILRTIIRGFENWKSNGNVTFNNTKVDDILAYLEKQKEQKPILDFKASNWYVSKVDGKIHDMDDSNPNKKYYSGVDDTLSNIAGILHGVYSEEKLKEQKPAEVDESTKRLNENWMKQYFNEQNPVDYEAELKKCKDNPLYFFDKYVSIKQKPAEDKEYSCPDCGTTSGCTNDESEGDKRYREGVRYALKQTEDYTIGKTFKGLIPCWVNAPSELQPAHKYHGKNAVIMHENNGGFRCCFIDDKKPVTVHLPEDTLFAEGWRKKPAEWDKNDTVFLNEITDYFENKTVRLQHDIDMYAHWLKSLPERFNLEPKQEWSEEDEKMHINILNLLCSQITYVTGQGTTSGRQYPTYAKERDWFEKRFKSLCPQPHWKPSEEQMSLLWSIYQGGEEQEPLRELIEQLKKL